jgi:hypothetical protein
MFTLSAYVPLHRREDQSASGGTSLGRRLAVRVDAASSMSAIRHVLTSAALDAGRNGGRRSSPPD